MGTEERPTTRLDELVAFRWADYDTPLWARANTRAGRWNRARQAPTQYWCLHPHGPWAELIRQEELHRESEVARVRQRLWTATWSLGPVADLRTFAHAERWGVSPATLVADDHSGCQDLGDRLRAEGIAGVLCPSAALPDTVNLVVFGGRIRAAWSAPPRLASSVPVAEIGRVTPPAGILGDVRQHGRPHSALARHLRGSSARPRPRRRPPPER